VGLPYNMDDTEVDWAPRVHRFARQISGRFGLTVHLVDERLTSIEAHRQLSTQPRAGAPDRDAIDALAAALILETWLCEQPRDPDPRLPDPRPE
jgi:putative holliday junction resolvase